MPSEASDNRKERERLRNAILDIFNHDERIRSVAIYEDQDQLAGGMRQGTKSHDPDAEARDIDLQLAKVGDTARSWQRWFGNLIAFTVKYEKVTLAFHPLGAGRFLVISSEPDFDPVSLESIVTQQGDKALTKDTS